MSDPRIAAHLPLLKGEWTTETARQFVSSKEQFWARDGLGHWAFRLDGKYIGWGGFQKEGDEWDFGLVLKPDAFGYGLRVAKKALALAQSDKRIPYVTILLPMSRTNHGVLRRLGAVPEGEIENEGITFRRFKMDTT
ncbi:GNAT family protein [uncultured Tateyamaria sp.]|uniref:GNAT family N-acetyltransferase n=1 Tax=uncultured Tateyamaria sp. TaxID=455651 RepID=UPI00262429ED|nr:GNAT family protein [uncultured Tateyamaria sp.]